MVVAQDVRDRTGLTTDEVSDAVLTTMIIAASGRVRSLTGQNWFPADAGFAESEAAIMYFVAAETYQRVNMIALAKEAETNALNYVQGLNSRNARGLVTA